MMYEAIKNFAKQFAFEPVVENASKLPSAEKFIVAGMGGSNLSPGLLKIWKPELDIVSHREYGLPLLSDAAAAGKVLIIASSYSGNTEETLDSFQEALRHNMPVAVIATGGKLLEMARETGVPFVRLPDTGIEPRSALGLSIKAILKLMSEEQGLAEVSALAASLEPLAYEEAGKELVNRLAGYVPVICASSRNFPIAYNWKIKFNETGKIPAFCSAFPELNHNEMNGFSGGDAGSEIAGLSAPFYFIFLKDSQDDPRIQARMDITAKLYRDRGWPVAEVPLQGDEVVRRIFSSLVLADWVAYHTARHYDVDPEHVPMVEELKRLIASRHTA